MFGGMGVTSDFSALPKPIRPLSGLVVLGMVLFGLAQFAMNMFGLDRNGFKSFIMMPVERWRILFGKNLALLPLTLTMGVALLGIMQIFLPMFFHHLVASVLQLITVSLGLLIMGNYVSTICPVAMSYGSMKPAQPKMSVVLLQALFVFLSPVLVLPSVAAIGIEYSVHTWVGLKWLPIYLLLSVVELAIAIWIYKRVLQVQGRFLHRREQKILEVVVSKNE